MQIIDNKRFLIVLYASDYRLILDVDGNLGHIVLDRQVNGVNIALNRVLFPAVN